MTDEIDSKSPPKQSTVPPTSDGTIVTYTGLSETTQERIRKYDILIIIIVVVIFVYFTKCS